ncbi:MAG: chorismate mutase [Alphaproteobacteria bacterium]|nr:chorismate mutase [Alphaproteobacteria bacterium]
MEELQVFRQKIDALDDRILALLGERYEVVREVGQLKRREGIALVQEGRVDEVLTRCAGVGEINGLDPAFVRLLYRLMIDHAHEVERRIIEGADS